MAIQNVSCTLIPGVVGLLGQMVLEKYPYENDMWRYEADFRYSQTGKV